MSTQKHNFIPEHTLLTDKQKETLLSKLHITIRELPKILAKDSAIEMLEPKAGDIIKITRKSRSAGISEYYRVVITE